MPVKVQCEQCNAQFTVADQFAGRRMKCKHCGNALFIPQLQSDDLVDLSTEAADLGEDTSEPSPWGTPIPSLTPSAVPPAPASQPSTDWRQPQKVIAREGEVAAVPLRRASAKKTESSREAGRAIDGLVLPMVLAYLAALVYLGVTTHARLPSEIPASAMEVAGGWITAQVWGQIAFTAIGYFAIAGPLTLAGLVMGMKFGRYPTPSSAYFRACALAAIPGMLLVLLLVSKMNNWYDPNMVVIAILAAAATFFLAVRFVLGVDFATTAVCFVLTAVLGTGGVMVAGMSAKAAAESLFQKQALIAINRARQVELEKRRAPDPAPSRVYAQAQPPAAPVPAPIVVQPPAIVVVPSAPAPIIVQPQVPVVVVPAPVPAAEPVPAPVAPSADIKKIEPSPDVSRAEIGRAHV